MAFFFCKLGALKIFCWHRTGLRPKQFGNRRSKTAVNKAYWVAQFAEIPICKATRGPPYPHTHTGTHGHTHINITKAEVSDPLRNS